MTTGITSGKHKVKAYFDESYMGVKIEKSEWLNVQIIINDTSDMAILTYNQQNHIRSKKDGNLHQVPLWNCTEIYRYSDKKWKIAHANWSFSQHPAILSSIKNTVLILSAGDEFHFLFNSSKIEAVVNSHKNLFYRYGTIHTNGNQFFLFI